LPLRLRVLRRGKQSRPATQEMKLSDRSSVSSLVRADKPEICRCKGNRRKLTSRRDFPVDLFLRVIQTTGVKLCVRSTLCIYAHHKASTKDF
jgi:hypothetical protein